MSYAVASDPGPLCACGCGHRAKLKTSHFLAGHNNQQRTASADTRAKMSAARTGRRLKAQVAGYRTADRGEYVHRQRAEHALGHPLPPGAVVHHADGSKAEDAPLVICENNAYHRLLHARMRVKAAGGNPNTDKICFRCRAPKPFAEFNKAKSQPLNLSAACRDCERRHLRDYRLRTGRTMTARGPNAKQMVCGRWQ